MAGYLITVSYDVLGVRKQATTRVWADDEASAISQATDLIVNYRTKKGDVLSNVSADVDEVT